MAIFTAIGAAFAAASTFIAGSISAASIGSFLLSSAASVGLNLASKALGKKPAAAQLDHFCVQTKLAAGGDISRSFQLGYSVTAGQRVYANTWALGSTPNAFLTQVIKLSDMPCGSLLEIWVDGQLRPLNGDVHPTLGNAVDGYKNAGGNHLWIKYFDGTQTTVDTLLTGSVSSAERPYESTRVGTGVAYVVVTALVDDTLFSGVPEFKFAVSGMPLYDISKDSTAGGSGPHRWNDKSTWGGDGDSLPAVQLYNILRGITFNGQWVYGLQLMTAPRLPAANWIAQIAKCRATVTGASGLEATYRSGGQINVSAQIANTVEALLTACQGRLSEIGGFYKLKLGAPGSADFNFTDDDLLSTEPQTFKPFFALDDSINGITATYPLPAEGWNTKAAPPIYRSDLEAKDGGRRLLASPSFDLVPYSAQVQRLMSSALLEAQRARTHVVVYPPAFWMIEPGDVGSWTSSRNSYTGKLFRVDAVVDRANLDVGASLTEVDPADFTPPSYATVTVASTALVRPLAQTISLSVTQATVLDASGVGRRAGINLIWDASAVGVVGVAYQIRRAGTTMVVASGTTDQVFRGIYTVTEGLLPSMDYEVSAQWVPSVPREVVWSSWIAITTPAIPFADLDPSISAQVTTVMDALNDRLAFAEQMIASIAANQDARNWNDKKEVRSQLSARTGEAFAAISSLKTVMTNADAALASNIDTVQASINGYSASITANTSAIATLNGYAALKYGIRADVNGYATGFDLINAGAGTSAFNIVADKFQIAQPGTTGGSLIPVFTIATVNGVTKLAMRSDMLVDGSITTQTIAAGAITANKMAVDSVTAANGAIQNLSIQSLKIGDNAVTLISTRSRPARSRS